MCWIQERIVCVVSAGFVNDRLVSKFGVQRQHSSTVADGVFLEEDGGCEGLDGKRDVLVIPCRIGCRPGNLSGCISKAGITAFLVKVEEVYLSNAGPEETLLDICG